MKDKEYTMSVIRWLGLAGLMCLAFALPGCSKDKAADGSKRYVIATVVKVDGIAWFETMREGVEAFGKDTGHQVLVLGPAKADAAEQVQIMKQRETTCHPSILRFLAETTCGNNVGNNVPPICFAILGVRGTGELGDFGLQWANRSVNRATRDARFAMKPLPMVPVTI